MNIKNAITNLRIIKRDRKEDGNSNLENKKYQLPATNADYLFEFKYKLFSLNTTIMMVVTLAIPLILSLILTYIPINKSSQKTGLQIVQFIKFILITFGFSYSLAKEKKVFIKSGAWGLYLYLLSLILAGFVAAVLAKIFSNSLIMKNVNDEDELSAIGKIVGFGCQTAIGLFTIILILWKAPELRKRIWLTIKQNYILLIAVLLIFVLILNIANAGFEIINKIINGSDSESENEKSLRAMFILLSGKIVLFIGTVLVIPFLEELATRQSIFSLSNNRWLGLIVSTIFFATMHLEQSGDFHKILPYISASFVFSFLFIVSRENILYPTILHIINNLIVYIVVISKVAESW